MFISYMRVGQCQTCRIEIFIRDIPSEKFASDLGKFLYLKIIRGGMLRNCYI